MAERLLSVEELSKLLNVLKSWVYSRTREKGDNAIPKIMVGKYVRFKFQDVMEWLQKQQNKSVNKNGENEKGTGKMLFEPDESGNLKYTVKLLHIRFISVLLFHFEYFFYFVLEGGIW